MPPGMLNYSRVLSPVSNAVAMCSWLIIVQMRSSRINIVFNSVRDCETQVVKHRLRTSSNNLDLFAMKKSLKYV